MSIPALLYCYCSVLYQTALNRIVSYCTYTMRELHHQTISSDSGGEANTHYVCLLQWPRIGKGKCDETQLHNSCKYWSLISLFLRFRHNVIDFISLIVSALAIIWKLFPLVENNIAHFCKKYLLLIIEFYNFVTTQYLKKYLPYPILHGYQYSHF